MNLKNLLRRTESRTAVTARYGVARVLSKIGICSRTCAAEWIVAGRVRLNGKIVRNPEYPMDSAKDKLTLDGKPIVAAKPRYIMLNKPRGLITTTADEQGRDTVYSLLRDRSLPWLAPVGRLDKASEGLLLLTNDSAWAARVLDPKTHVSKTYHVQVDQILDSASLQRLRNGTEIYGEILRAKKITVLRQGQKNSWLEVILDEGKNRQIRRLMEAFGIKVVRLVRVAIGPVALANLAKGQWRELTLSEVKQLANPGVMKRTDD